MTLLGEGDSGEIGSECKVLILGDFMKSEVVTGEENILQTLQRLFPNSSKNTLRIMLTKGRVNIDGEVVYRAKHGVSTGQKIEISDKPKADKDPYLRKQQKRQSKLEIIWEDDAILVLNKPAGLLSVATKMEDETLHSWANEYVKRKKKSSWCYIVHRLDKETSGIWLWLSLKGQRILQEQFAERSLHRVYNALIEGDPKKPRHGPLIFSRG